MARRYFVPVLLLGLGCGVLAALPTSAADPDADAARIAKLIDQLGSPAFEEREKAGKDLDAVGPPALESLRKAVKSDDAEVSRRAADLVKIIEKRAETLNVLKPTKVHLVFKNTPVTEALAEFKKKSGYHIALHDPEGKLKDRTITLDTGETTFWQAFDQFCAKAGVHEATPQELFNQPQLAPNGPFAPGGRPQLRSLPPPVIQVDPILPPAGKPEKLEKRTKDSRAFGFAAEEKPAAVKPVAPAAAAPPPPPVALPPGDAIAVPIIGRPGRAPVAGQQPGQIIVADGKPEALPTAYAGAVRVRALSKADTFGPAGEDEILVVLEITPEPKLTWQRLIGVKLEKALDDKDQKLGEALPPAGPGGLVPAFPGGIKGPPGIAIGRPAVWGGGFSNCARQITVVRLKKGDKASKSLKELTGAIAAEVLTEPKTLIRTDEIMKSAGKTFKGDEGGAIKVLSVDKEENDQVKVLFEFEQPEGFTPLNGGGFPGRGIKGAPVPAPVPLPLLPPAKGQVQRGPGLVQVVQVVQAAPAQRVQAIQIQVGGGVAAPVRRGFGFAGAGGLKLIDDKGQPVEGQLIQVEFRGPMAGGPVEPNWVLTFPFKKDQAEHGKLTYSASKSATIEIPFTLKDIVLP